MKVPFLDHPHIRYRDSFLEATLETILYGERPRWNYEKLEQHFDEFVENCLAHETDPVPGAVPQTDYWLIADGDYAGTVRLRHFLNDGLERFGGHIGYEIRPSRRRRGYGKLICHLALEEARKRGITKVLITCDDDNIGSQKIIEHNGGVLQDKVDNGRHALTRRYWIHLD